MDEISLRTRRLASLVVALVAASVALAGCTIAPNAPQQGGIGTDAGSVVVIEIKDMKYMPESITVAPGTTIKWINMDPFPHTVTPTDAVLWGTPGSGDALADWLKGGEEWSFTFTKEGTYLYYCIPHASKAADGEWRGQVGEVIVKAGAAAPGAQNGASAVPPPMRALDIDEIGADASAIPSPITRNAPAHLTWEIRSTEVTALMNDGTSYTYWTFDDQVPGPMLRARVGDTITVVHTNDPSSTLSHNIDFHATTGPHGGAGVLTSAPGETTTLTFKAMNPGVFIYHCADASPPVHVGHGMYGLIVIEPEEGLPPVDKEFYVVQGDFYSDYPGHMPGHHSYSAAAAATEIPSFVVFNGRMGSLTGERALQAEVGDTVRIFFGVGGPNLVSSFHVIGEIFDRVYQEGDLESSPARSVQTTLVPAGGAVMVEFAVEYPGDYILVDHSLNRVLKGAAGILTVTGEADDSIFREG